MKRIIAAVFIVTLLGASQPIAISQNRDMEAEARRKADKEFAEKRYRELKEATEELNQLAQLLTEQVEKSSEHVISARIIDTTEKIEKVVKRIRSRARGY